MSKLPWGSIIAWLLAAFFVVGGSLNIFAPTSVLEDYQRWGYPEWFHYLTGSMEWLVAILFTMPKLRIVGSILGGLVMSAAAMTVLFHGEYTHAVAPFVVLMLIVFNYGLTSKK